MKKILKKWSSLFLVALLLATPLYAAADESVSKQLVAPESSKGLFYRREPLGEKSVNTQVDSVLQLANSGGFDRLYYSLLSKMGNQQACQLTSIQLKGQKEDSLQDLSHLAARLKEEGLSLTLVLDPFRLDSSHPAYPFLRNVAEHGGALAVLDGDTLCLDPALARNQSLAQWNLQSLLAAGSSADELLLPNTAFLSPIENGQANSQIAQAQRMASFLEGVSGSGLSISILYESISSPYQCNDKILSQPGLQPQTLVENQLAGSVYPVLDPDLTGYEDQVSEWIRLSNGLNLIPLLKAGTSDQRFEISSQIFLVRQMGLSAIAVSDYQQLAQDSSETASLLSAALAEAADLIPEGYSLKIPQTFGISRPIGSITITSSAYYVMGTSNPNVPLYLDGKLVERQASNGGFGVYLTDIPIGITTYTFTQGSQSKSITITRKDPSQSSVSYISKIVQSSMYPYYNEGVAVGESIALTCTAPAGASVSATFQGKTVSLTQKAAATSGVPATYTATMTMPDAGQDEETTKIGPIVYTLTYNGTTSQYTSSGEMYAVGKNTTLAVMANDYINNVYGDVSIADDFYMTLYNGACDYVEEVTNSYYKLRSGGYLPKSTAEILDGAPVVNNQISSSKFTVEARGESLTLSGTAKAPYKAEMSDTALTVTLWNTTGVPQQLEAPDSALFTEISAIENEDGSVTLTFSYQDGVKLWGYNVEYDGNNIVIFAKTAPVLAQTAGKPLDGIVVVIDAGHGGDDPGALGIAGSNGPTETDLNFISAYASKQILELLGATVHMVSEDDSWLSFEDRMDPARSLRADFFLSFHHNSTGESVDSSQSFGTEIYYHEEQSQAFAENILDSITTAAGRNARGAYQDYYRVTRMTYAPSLLLELGFVVNPVEYQDLCQPIRIYQTALGVADGIIRTIENFR